MKRILLVWNYGRRSYVAPFEALRTRFDFVFLSELRPGAGSPPVTDLPRVYWADFSSVDEVLDRLKPDAIVFMDLVSGRAIALNVAARARSITTIVLQHGIAFNVEAAVSSAPISASSVTRALASAMAAARQSRTIWKHLGLSGAARFAAYFSSYQLSSLSLATRLLRGEFGRPDQYVCFDPSGVEFYEFQDGTLDAQRAIIIGNPEFDSILRQARPPGDSHPYYLMIDSALVENPWGHQLVALETMLGVYDKLASFAASKGARLRVKLHPFNYNATWLPSDARIDWLRDCEIGAQLRGARGCFALPSTLVVVAVILAPTCVLLPHPDSLTDDLVARGITNAVDLRSFQPSEQLLRRVDTSSPGFEAFVKRYLHSTDGCALDRLADTLFRACNRDFSRRT